MAEAACPASCGELIQGWLQGSEKLVSCPIDWYSTVSVHAGNAQSSHERPMMRRALQLTLHYYKMPATLERELAIDYQSTIPVAKGMASSTADIAATIMATARHLNQEMSEQDLGLLCGHLEPSDSTMIAPLALFDHRRGQIITRLAPPPDMDILVLESPLCLETSLYHLMNRHDALHHSASALDDAYQQLSRALSSGSPRELGQACVISAIESQKILHKPRFRCLLDLVERHQLFGLNVAHSGSVVGLLFDGQCHDIERVIHEIQGFAHQHYNTFHLTKMVSGGVI